MKTYTLKELRNKKQETQQKTAKAIDINRALYSHYENGRRVPRIDVAKKIAEHFGVKVDQIRFINKNKK
ncbi:helix-turn-helix transcriptional regulator [Tissierella praeacuta]|uniref:helix-turn-helix transcriptional regulator n=1 Tax=Tissierella praeacuta TaxID=43131 RepID=UPI0028ADEE00|nr:helix-turn-helix transcriptional regulator [Tissierella praeacuta]